ncbi:lipase [Williamsia sp. 1138]|uniref:Alpha/beta hydrolase n=1 Tax=Gordonia rubripertincta TaxID=36822 RepID=A0ABT4MS56_GORRU|nr:MULTISPECIES: alpha/beta hydrolase [Mycobacteriales]MCZ4548861.1 alpha/beta hydrolase [Gordonia rubripertincta]OZG28693.1 lipase [Williamsia sp. 1138]
MDTETADPGSSFGASWDPDVAAMVSLLKGAEPLRNLGVDRARDLLESIKRPPGPDMHSVRSATIDGTAAPVPVRVYHPHGVPTENAPALIWFHGGGMIMGTLDSFDRLAREVAEATQAVLVNVDYRLAPEHTYPAANDDAYAVVCRVYDTPEEWGIDPHRIGVGGDSAGGGLAAATALRARNLGGPPLAQQVLIYPGVERRQDRESMRTFGQSPFLTAGDIDWMKDMYLGEDQSNDDEYGVPALASTLAGLPPAIVACGHNDPLRDGVEVYGHRLQAAGVPTAILRYPGVGHGFVMQTANFTRARQAIADIGALAAARFSSFG